MSTIQSSYKNLELLFDDNHKIYVSNLNSKKGPYQQLIANTPTLIQETLNREIFCINPVQGTRKKENVSAYVNFMFESDKVSLANQHALLPKLIDLELARTITFSGNKSLHIIVSCADNLNLGKPGSQEAEERYKAIWLGLEKMFNSIGFLSIDSSNKNPAGLSRLPGAIRSNGVVQELLHTGKLVDAASLQAIAVQTKPRTIKLKKHFEGDLQAFEKLMELPEHAKFASFIKNPGWVQSGDGNHPMIFRLVCWAHDEFNLNYDLFVALFAKYIEPVFIARGYYKNWKEKAYGAYLQKGYL